MPTAGAHNYHSYTETCWHHTSGSLYIQIKSQCIRLMCNINTVTQLGNIVTMYIPQRATVSSDPSPQSFSVSHLEFFGIHKPLAQENSHTEHVRLLAENVTFHSSIVSEGHKCVCLIVHFSSIYYLRQPRSSL